MNARLPIRSENTVKIIAYAQQVGEVGFTCEDAALAMGIRRDVVNSIVGKLRIAARIARVSGVIRRNVANTASVAVYRYSVSEVMAIVPRYVLGPQEYRNVYDYIRRNGHDEDYTPMPAKTPISATPGSDEKVNLLRNRIECGQDLWHPEDTLGGFARSQPMKTNFVTNASRKY